MVHLSGSRIFIARRASRRNCGWRCLVKEVMPVVGSFRRDAFLMVVQILRSNVPPQWRKHDGRLVHLKTCLSEKWYD